MSQLVERVRGHLKKQDLETAFRVLIEAWRELRAPAIANAVDAIDALVPTPDAQRTDAWIRAARSAKTHREKGALLRTIAQRPAAEIATAMEYASKWQDPRLTTRIVELLRALPFSGQRTRDVWRAVFAVARAQQDPRLLEVAKTLPETWNVGADTKTFLNNRLEEAIAGLVEPALPAEVATALTSLASEVAPPRAEPPANATSLLDAIYANPADDEARLVYADWLQERGDPLGELIALQLQPADKRDLRLEKELIKKHKKTWLGPLATVLTGEVEFRRGFVAKGVARFRHQRDAEQLGTLREWATVEELEYNPSGTRWDQAAWTRFLSPAMSGLRVVRFPDPRWLASPTPWRIEELWVDLRDPKAFATVCANESLVHLENLVVRGIEPAFLEGLERSPPQLTVLDVQGLRDKTRRTAWFAAVAKLPLERFTILWFGSGSELHHHFTRDDDRAFSRLAIEIRRPREDEPTTYELRELKAELEQLPEGSLTHFDARFFTTDTESQPIPELLRAAKKARLLA